MRTPLNSVKLGWLSSPELVFRTRCARKVAGIIVSKAIVPTTKGVNCFIRVEKRFGKTMCPPSNIIALEIRDGRFALSTVSSRKAVDQADHNMPRLHYSQ